MKQIVTIITLLFIVEARGEGLTFAAARDMMLENNLEIKAAREAVEVANLERKAARGMRYPTIDLIGSYTLMQRDIKIDIGGSKGILTETAQNIINNGISSGLITENIAGLISQGMSPLLAADWGYTLQKRSVFMGGLSVAQPIYMGGRIDAAIAAADIVHQKAEYELRAIINSKITTLVEYYYGVILADEVTRVRENVVKGIQEHLKDALAMEEEGMIAHSELLYVEYKLSEAERELFTSINKQRLAREALQQILNCDIVDNLTDRIFVVESVYNIEYYTQSCVDLNPIILDARCNIALMKQNQNVARASLLPEIAALGGAVVASHNLSDMLPRWSIGVGVRFNIFDGLSKERRYVAAQRASESIFTIIDEATNKLVLQAENVYYMVINSIKDTCMMQSSIEFAKSYYEAKAEGFKEGLTTSSELIDAELELQAAELKQLVSAHDFCKSLAQLLEVSGLSDTFDNYRSRAIFL